MADAPQMLPAEELDRLSQRADALIGNYGASARVVTLRCARSLLDHIAALTARIAKLEAAGDAMAEDMISHQFGSAGPAAERVCLSCAAVGEVDIPDAAHDPDCPVPAWRKLRENADG